MKALVAMALGLVPFFASGAEIKHDRRYYIHYDDKGSQQNTICEVSSVKEGIPNLTNCEPFTDQTIKLADKKYILTLQSDVKIPKGQADRFIFFDPVEGWCNFIYQDSNRDRIEKAGDQFLVESAGPLIYSNENDTAVTLILKPLKIAPRIKATCVFQGPIDQGIESLFYQMNLSEKLKAEEKN